MLTTELAASGVASPPARRWSPATRVAFRFCLVYFGLTILFTQFFTAVFQLPSPAFVTGVPDLFAFVGTHVFRVGPITLQFSGSGDKLIDWAADSLVLDGTLDGRLVHLELKQVDLNSFLLNSRGFHWIQEVPFNR